MRRPRGGRVRRARGGQVRGARPRAAALALCTLALATGCASLPLALASLRPLPRACGGPLLPVDAMGADFALQARYRARRGEREEALLLAAEKRGTRLVVVGLDPLGTQVFAVVQEGSDLRRESHLRALFPFAPENALRDLVEARFPEAVAALPAAADERARRTRKGAAVHLARPRCGWEATVEVLTNADAAAREMGGDPRSSGRADTRQHDARAIRTAESFTGSSRPDKPCSVHPLGGKGASERRPHAQEAPRPRVVRRVVRLNSSAAPPSPPRSPPARLAASARLRGTRARQAPAWPPRAARP